MSHEPFVQTTEYHAVTNFPQETSFFKENQLEEALKFATETKTKLVEVKYWATTRKTIFDPNGGSNA